MTQNRSLASWTKRQTKCWPKLDWGLVTTVCDKAAHTTDKEELRLGVRAARKRIQNEQHKVVMFGLQVIDALVKNNSTNFYFLQFMAEQKMMNSLVRLVDRGIDKGVGITLRRWRKSWT